MKKYLLLFILVITYVSSQSQNSIIIGILTDKSTEESRPLLEQLKSEIIAVVGQETIVSFNDVLENDFNNETAEQNYQALINNDTDIILSFGLTNTIMLYQKKTYNKPTIVFGSINKDFLDIPENQKTSAINNLTYLFAPFSYKDDLDTFRDLFVYKKIGIIVDEYQLNNLPLKNIFDPYFKAIESNYKLINIANLENEFSELEDVDAIYLASNSNLTIEKLKELINNINQKKLPSFSAFGERNVVNGILATNQPSINVNQFFRRIALNVESIIGGVNASELPIYLNYNYKLTINHATATQIDFPLRYSLLAIADIIGGDNIKTASNSLSILDIMNDVVGNNLSLQVEKKDVELTDQDIKTAKSNYLPNVNSGVDAIYIDPNVAELSGGQNPELSTSGNVTLQQLIYSEEASANIDINNELQKAQQEVYNVAELDALLNASVSYFNALILKTNASLQNQNLQVTKKNLQYAEHNFEAGASGKEDILRLRSQLAQNIQALIDAGNQVAQSFNTINQLMNNPISKKIDIKDAELSKGIFNNYRYEELMVLLDNPELQPILIEFLNEEAINNSPELKNIGYNLNVIDRNYRLNNTGRYIPTVAFQGQYNLAINQSGKGASFPIGSPNVPDGTYNLGLNVSLPIFQQNQRNINKRTTIIQKDQISMQIDNIQLNIEKNVNDIVLDLTGEIANIEISKIAEQNAKESLELTQNAYKIGAVSIIQLIDAQTNYLQAQLAKTTANYNYLIASMQLERAIGYFFIMHSETDNQAFIQRANLFILNKN
jgi:outer membrane protein TolC